MKLLQYITPLMATLAFISSAVLAGDTPDSPCVPPSTLETITTTQEPAPTASSTSALETVTLSSDTAELSTTETSSKTSTEASSGTSTETSSKASTETASETSTETSSESPDPECQTDEPSSVSISTAPVPTTSVVVNMPHGAVNASMLEWTIVWRRCNMPSTASGFETRKASTTRGLSVSVSTVKSSASAVV